MGDTVGVVSVGLVSSYFIPPDMSDPSSSEQPQRPDHNPEPTATTLLMSHFDKLIAVVEKLNVTMEGQKGARAMP